MGDLINRSELYMNDLIRRKDVLALFPTNDCSDKMIGLYERVLDIPRAYDVEKVVAELEQYATSPICKIHKVGCPYRNNDNIACENCGALGAIDIVRKGGVE